MEKNKEAKTLNSKDIILTTFCNNNCKNCLLEKSLRKEYKSLSCISKEIYKNIGKGYERIILLGGEPTIHPDFLKVVKLGKKVGYSRVSILSNGRMFSYMKFLKSTIESGANEIIISIYSHKPQVQDYITGVKGSLKQTLKALKNIKQLNYPLTIGTVITKKNYRDLPELAKILIKIGINQHHFEFIRPIGRAQINYSMMVPRMKKVVGYLDKAIKEYVKNKVDFRIEGMPFCIIPNYPQYINTIDDEKMNDISETDIKDHVKFKTCKMCKYDKLCVGVWKEYAKKEGGKEFVPVKD